jgi:hypothetical protein
MDEIIFTDSKGKEKMKLTGNELIIKKNKKQKEKEEEDNESSESEVLQRDK